MDDHQVVQRVAQGDEAAAAELFTRFRYLVMGVCRKRGLSRDESEDMTQDVFWRLFDSDCAVLRAWRGSGELGAYIRRIADHKALDYIEQRARRRTVQIEGTPDPVNESEDLEAKALLGELQAMMRKAIAQLSEAQQAAVNAVYIDELSYAEAANRLAITSNALGVRLNGAKKALDKIILRDYPALHAYRRELGNDLGPKTVSTVMGFDLQ
jgi:RNA polymerase sigma-70 factor (ECF subfamily)